MHTIDEAQNWIALNKERLIAELQAETEVPDYMKKSGGIFEAVYCTAGWLNGKLKEAGATEKEVQDICFMHGQRCLTSNPYDCAVNYLNQFESSKIQEKPGLDLALKIISGN